MAPEILGGQPLDSKVDSWSLGVILFELLMGYQPFKSDNEKELIQQITKCEIDFDEDAEE